MTTVALFVCSCGNNVGQTGESKYNTETETQTETAVEEQTEAEGEEILADGEIEDDGVAPGDCEIPGIRKAWAKNPISPVAADKGADIGNFAYAFCTEYAKYLPNKSLAEYLEFPDRYEEEVADYRVEDQKKKEYSGMTTMQK